MVASDSACRKPSERAKILLCAVRPSMEQTDRAVPRGHRTAVAGARYRALPALRRGDALGVVLAGGRRLPRRQLDGLVDHRGQ